MARKKQAAIEKKLNAREIRELKDTSARIGFSISRETHTRYTKLAKHLGVTKKDLFVALIDTAYDDLEEQK